MARKPSTMKFTVTDEQAEVINAAYTRSRYRTRSQYLLDAALSGAPEELFIISREIGKLGRLCNELLLLADEPKGEGPQISSIVTRKLARKIIATCDEVRAAMRGL